MFGIADKMNIFFDHQTFSLQNYGGISRYFTELIQGINIRTKHHAHLSITYSDNVYIRDVKNDVKHFMPGFEFERKLSARYYLNRFLCQLDLRKTPFDVMHPTYYDPYFLSQIGNKPFVVTFLDMIHERLANEFKDLAEDRKITARKKLMAEKSTAIIAISESTKQDIVDLFKVDPQKINVIYLGNSLQSFSKADIETSADLARPYVLFVGNRWSYKNFRWFIQTIRPLLVTYGIRVVCAGGGAFTKEEIKFIEAYKLTGLVEQRPIDDRSLSILYRNALAFVFPSLYEGFGIPVLEAFACDCPCIVSNQSSLPEVAGDAALYISPNNPDSLIDAIERFVNDDNLRQEYIRKGQQQLAKFSWQNTVDETVKLYQSIQ